MKKAVYIVCMFLCAQVCYSTTRTAKSCSFYDVSTIINTVSSGDTVFIPSDTDTVIWKNELKITKDISIFGAGIGKTCIRWGGNTNSSVFSFSPKDSNLNGVLRISGFTIDIGRIDDVKGISIINANTKKYFSNVRIDHNEIIGASGNAGYAIFIHGLIYGLVDNNRISQNVSISITWR